MHHAHLKAKLQRVPARDARHASLGAIRLARNDVPLVDTRLQVILECELRIGVWHLKLVHESLGQTERRDIRRTVRAELLEAVEAEASGKNRSRRQGSEQVDHGAVILAAGMDL